MQDLFDANAMLTVTSRTDKALADGILKLLEKKWDKETIKRHAGNFSLEKMAAQYIAVYAEQINKENTGNR
ncbi:hypothetical protein SDC9_189984 [bioreactor metagenome]|uniref:Glycosyl transferase family 1 domain-containing protein n=1 Tax=bioreactor metagenome TaxID=1076179 RepID=A0A645HTX6_9ZZZZ